MPIAAPASGRWNRVIQQEGVIVMSASFRQLAAAPDPAAPGRARAHMPPGVPAPAPDAPAATPVAAGSCLVVVPTYNEAPNIERLVTEILGQGPQFDVLVVDDNSPDRTGDLVAALAARTPRVQLIRRSGKLGLGGAYLAGFREGLRQGYRFLCEMDADFSHQPRYLPVLLAVAERAADVALGSRNVPGGRVEN